MSSRETFNKKIKQSLAPSEFVTLVYNASYVVTSSYHGTVFSLLFQKDFSAVQLDSRNNDRITSLLESIGLEDRIISQSDEDITYTSINYAQIIPKLVTMRTISEDFVYSLIK